MANGGSRDRPAAKREGTVQAALPRGLYRVRCDDGHVVTASLAGRTKQVTVAVKPGDRVTVTLSQFDPTRAKITERHR